MVVIDTDVLLLAFAFQADARQADNTRFVTWNARHFREKSSLPVWTPAEFLARQAES